jgi:hypothetical protein
MIRRSLDIEALLVWAYRDELAKRYISSAEGNWDKIRRVGLGIISTKATTAAQRYPHFGVPHPDALTIEDAVNKLRPVDIDWSARGRFILGDLFGMLDIAQAASLVRWNTSAWVTSHAHAGTRPAWDLGPMRCYPIIERRGRGNGVKIVGECRGKNKYTSGTYCPLHWEPSPFEIAEVRGKYFAWYFGLVELAKILRGALLEHEALMPRASADPWRNPNVEAQLVDSLLPRDMKTRPLGYPRPRALPRGGYRIGQAISRKA